MPETRQLSKKTENLVLARVRRDLEPSRWLVHAKVGAAVGLGGVLSLFLCGQLGLGLSTWAHAAHGLLMGFGGVLGCTAVCGILFAVVPVLTLKLVASPLQFRLLFRQEWPVIAGWMAAFGGVLVLANGRADPLWILALWSLAALASFQVLSLLLHRVSMLAGQRQNLWWPTP